MDRTCSCGRGCRIHVARMIVTTTRSHHFLPRRAAMLLVFSKRLFAVFDAHARQLRISHVDIVAVVARELFLETFLGVAA